MTEDIHAKLISEFSNTINDHTSTSEKVEKERIKLWIEKSEFLRGILEKFFKSFINTIDRELIRLKTHKKRKKIDLTNVQINLLDKEYEEVNRLISLRLNIDDVELYVQTLKSLLSGEYKIPKHPQLIFIQLSTIATLYTLLKDIGDIPEVIEHKIDFIMVRLVHEALLFYPSFFKSKTEYERTEKSIDAIRKKRDANKQKVLETYIRISDRSNMKLHPVAKIIKGKLEERNQSPPSLDTIKRYLKKEGYY